jgi:hypothetical protein
MAHSPPHSSTSADGGPSASPETQTAAALARTHSAPAFLPPGGPNGLPMGAQHSPLRYAYPYPLPLPLPGGGSGSG